MPSPAMKKATKDAITHLKQQGKAALGQGSDIYGGDDYDPTAAPDPAPAPPYEPRLTPNTPQVKNPEPPGTQGVRGAPVGRAGGGGRGSGGGGVMLKNRRMMGPAAIATPDYDFKLMAKGGSVSFAKGGGNDYGKDYRKGK